MTAVLRAVFVLAIMTQWGFWALKPVWAYELVLVLAAAQGARS